MTIYQSSSYETLTIQLAINLKASTHSIFQPEYIIGANAVTKNYLKEQLALQNSIVANLHFLTWNELIQNVFKALKPPYFDVEFVSPITSTQYLFDILSEGEFQAEFPRFSAYYAGSTNKQYGLAQKLQHLYSNYVKYNPSLLQNWKNGQLETTKTEEAFECALWTKLRQKLKDNKQYDSFHILETIQYEVTQQSPLLENLAQKIPSFHVVRMENMTQYQTDIIQMIAPYVGVNCYSCTLDWNTADNLAKLWSNYAPKQEQNTSKTILNSVDTLAQNTTLHALKQLFTHKTASTIALDQSIQIHGHFTPFREVEGLLNTLIETFVDKAFYTRDIMVYCNDLKSYIPAIHHFFNHQNYAIPYRIIGEYAYSNDTAIHALEALLHYNIAEMNPEEMMLLLQFSHLQKRFGLEDVESIRTWIAEANIVYQYDGDKQQDMHYISWKNGLDRLLLGSCIGKEMWYDDALLLLDATEGNRTTQLIHFRYFVEQLHRVKTQENNPKTIVDWIGYTTELMAFFFDLEDTTELDYLTSQLAYFDTGSEALLAYQTWLIMLAPLIKHPQTVIPPNVGGVTFVELKNAQVLPANVTALLGLNYSNYPSNTKIIAFDLLKDHAEYKVKSTKERDKFAFLQCILQTKTQLYISYLSKDAKSNTAMPPSILVEQLIDAINTISTAKLTIVQHPLHSFSSLYNQQNGLTSYTQTQLAKDNFKDAFNIVEPTENGTEKTISVKQLVGFFMDSFKHFYNVNLGIYINEEQSDLPNREKFTLDSLDRWSVRNYLLQNRVDWRNATPAQQANVIKQLKAQGTLPLNHLGTIALENAYRDYSLILDAYTGQIAQKEAISTTVRYSVQIENTMYHIESVKDIFEGQYLVPACYSNTLKHEIEWLIDSYLLLANNACDSTLIYTQASKNKQPILKEKKLDATNIEHYIDVALLQQLLTVFHDGQARLVPSYMPRKMANFEDARLFMKALEEDPYKSEYLTMEFYKSYFTTDKQVEQELYDNYKRIYHLISKF